MKKILLFVLGAMLVLPLAADNYVLESDGTYSYTGTPVSELSVDFTTWSTSDLPTTLYDDMPLSESHNMGFVKWKITSRNCGSEKGTVNALFNNDWGDFSPQETSDRNNNTSNKPRVFLPTTAYGVKSIKISGVVAGSYSQPIAVYYKDASQASWKWKGSLTLATTYGEVSLELNTVGQTSIYLLYDKTAYCTITDLELDLETPLYEYNTSTERYDYIGEPVESLSVDFTTWWASYLPSTLSDDMSIAEKNGLGFVKWKMNKRTCGAKGEVYALFNNNNGDFSGGLANNNTTNKPRIYLPTTARGVKKITVFGGNSNVSLGIYYKDAEHSNWTWKASLALTAGFSEVSVDLNTAGQTSLYLEYGNTPYVAITNIDLELEDPLYALNTESGIYEYQGDPVDAVSVDFTTLSTNALPGPLTDDMALRQLYGLGFVKWKTKWYGNPLNKCVLLNDNNNDFNGGPTNATTTNKPAIYFPTTVRGIESVAIRYVSGTSAFWLNYSYTDGLGTTSNSVQLPASEASDPQTYVLNLNTAGATSLHFLYAQTVWVRILSIEFTIKDSENTPIGLWDYTTSTGNVSKLTEANGLTRDVYLKRAFVADGDYYTLCLPFDLTAEQVTAAFGTCTLKKMTSSERIGSDIQLTFDDVNYIEAGVPYLFLPSADIAELEFPGVTINTDASTTINTAYFRMTGIYNPTSLSSTDYFLGADNYLVPVSGDSPLRPFRAYFQTTDGPALAPGVRARVVFSHKTPTEIENIQPSATGVQKIFREGQFYIIRDGKEYNVQGQLVK